MKDTRSAFRRSSTPTRQGSGLNKEGNGGVTNTRSHIPGSAKNRSVYVGSPTRGAPVGVSKPAPSTTAGAGREKLLWKEGGTQ